jgi:hypothetical protein
MFCPKCGASLKDGAKFCHSCGYNMVETPATPQPQQQSQQPAAEQPAGPGFDISKTPMKDWIFAGAAMTGAICVFLPWISAGWFTISGLNSTLGVFSLLVFLGIAGLVIFGQVIGLKNDVKEKILKFAPLGVASFLLIDLLRILVRSHGYASPGFGLILALLISVALILLGLKVIKLK